MVNAKYLLVFDESMKHIKNTLNDKYCVVYVILLFCTDTWGILNIYLFIVAFKKQPIL